MKKKVCIVGAGGFGREVLCCLLDRDQIPAGRAGEAAVFMVDDAHYSADEIMGVSVIPFSKFDAEKYDVVIAIGDPAARKQMKERLPENTSYTTIIHPSVVMSEWVKVGEGSVITAGTILTCNIVLGAHTHLNLQTTIGHDCNLGDYFTTAPGAKISGNCQTGICVYIGTNASLRQGVKICDHVTIGMGGVVLRAIEEPGVYTGVPVQRIVKK
ncbi:MAG: acetyltransferase [Bacteroidia bacterium]